MVANPKWPDEPPSRRPARSALQRVADDIAVGGAAVGADQMVEIQAARQLDAERPVDPGLLGRVPGRIWLAIVGVLVIISAFFLGPGGPT